MRTISPVDPEYCGTCLPWDLHSQKHILSGVYQGQGTEQFIQASSMRGPHVRRCMDGLYLPPGLAGSSLPLTPILAVVCSSSWVLIFFQGLAPPIDLMVKYPPHPHPPVIESRTFSVKGRHSTTDLSSHKCSSVIIAGDSRNTWLACSFCNFLMDAVQSCRV